MGSAATQTFTLTVNAATTTTLSSSPSSSVFGQLVTFTATVKAVAPATGTPTGSVIFMDGSNTLDPVPLALSSGRQPSRRAPSRRWLPHQITAVYSGDSKFATSTSTAVPQTVSPATTKTTVPTSSANPSSFGQAVTFTATVKAVAPGSGTPTGSVTFMDGSATLGTAPLSGGSASYMTSALPLAGGPHSITAVYGGDGNFTTSTSAALTQKVNKDATTTSLMSSASSTIDGQSVTFTATVSATGLGSGTPTPSGTVKFYDGAKVIGTGMLGAGSPDTATFTTSSLSVGSHTITAIVRRR